MKIKPQYVEVAGEQLVMLSAKDYDRLAQMADVWEPPLPAPNEDGNYPIEAIAVVIAQGILRDRRKLGWSQAELARRAGIRIATLNRIEHGKHSPNESVMQKIDRALKAARRSNGTSKLKPIAK